jgi:glucose/arabinose dehydrogenase
VPLWQGIQGFAFHPNYPQNGYFYVKYLSNVTGGIVVSRFTRQTNNPNAADPNSEQTLLSIPNVDGHAGGDIAFGADGYLYIPLGDNKAGQRGEVGDPLHLSQNLGLFNGKIFRIDVNNGSPYAIPPSNPYQQPNDNIPDEIWARGVRNPWRISFDRQTGDFWMGDNGQDGYEEVDFLAAPFTTTDYNFG